MSEIINYMYYSDILTKEHFDFILKLDINCFVIPNDKVEISKKNLPKNIKYLHFGKFEGSLLVA